MKLNLVDNTFTLESLLTLLFKKGKRIRESSNITRGQSGAGSRIGLDILILLF